MEQAEQSQRVRQLIFVVDDESSIARTLAMILDREGFEAHAFEDPQKALAACHEMNLRMAIRYQHLSPEYLGWARL